jgi:hypothetical protein
LREVVAFGWPPHGRGGVALWGACFGERGLRGPRAASTGRNLPMCGPGFYTESQAITPPPPTRAASTSSCRGEGLGVERPDPGGPSLGRGEITPRSARRAAFSTSSRTWGGVESRAGRLRHGRGGVGRRVGKGMGEGRLIIKKEAHPLSARSMALRLWHNVTILFCSKKPKPHNPQTPTNPKPPTPRQPRPRR